MAVSDSIGPARRAFAVVPSDTQDLPRPVSGVFVGVKGDLRVTLVDDAPGTSVTLMGISSGEMVLLQARRVWATGTTASNIVAFYP